MASPMPTQPVGGWSNNGQAMPPQSECEESGVQVRPMGLKVLYKFNREDRFDCLARLPQTFNMQTITIDDTTTIGVADLRLCIQAVVECSPELPGRECDYTIYAHDYSEPDTPLVGQGMLSSALNSMRDDVSGQPPKMVTGLVTKNKLGLLMGNANRETLEVKLKFTETPRLHKQQQQQQHQQPPQSQSQTQPQQQPDGQHQAEMYQPHGLPMTGAMTPTGTTEWNHLMQSNPQIGQQANLSRGASPALFQCPPQKQERRDSVVQAPQPQADVSQTVPKAAPAPVDQPTGPQTQGPPSRPSSRASKRAPRRKAPTGNPRGRPRKKPMEGNTSGYEDGTEGEDGPAKKRGKTTANVGNKANAPGCEDGTEGEDGSTKKRVQTTKVDNKTNTNPFGSEPESLRVAASTSGSLRNFRPIAPVVSGEGVRGNHPQEAPRAPTPVPHAPVPTRGPNRKGPPRGSAMSREISANQPSPQSQRTRALSPSQEDGRSPESTAPTPAYSDDSPAEIGSSPPVPRTTSFMQSSPPPSSPMLPPMPEPQASQDDGLENDHTGGLLGEELSRPAPVVKAPAPGPAPKPKTQPRRGPRQPSSTIPMQVFRMEEGPDGGQDMVYLRSFNTPDPTSAPAAPSDPPPRPPRKSLSHQQQSVQKQPQVPSPPQTTDAVEKPTSPSFPTEDHLEAVPQHTMNPEPITQQPPESQPSVPVSESSMEQARNVADDGLKEDPKDVADLQPPPTNATQDGEQQNAKENEAALPNKPKPKPQAKPRKLARSQSAGPLALPAVPASEPPGPSSLAQSTKSQSEEPAAVNAPASLRRAASSGPLNVPVPASDPVAPDTSFQNPPSLAFPTLAFPIPAPPDPACPPGDTVPTPSSPSGDRFNKNSVKKNAIKQRLEVAIRKGEMPPFCSNCGAIETPTWRKIWVQEYIGVPQPVEYSSRPGKITAIEILERDSEQNPTSYRVIKKALAAKEDKSGWREYLLCNPCGIWLVKSNCHRPQDRWDKDAGRLDCGRKRRGPDSSNGPRAKKPRTKSNPQVNLTSEACAPTDAPEPIEPSSPKQPGDPAESAERTNTQEWSPKGAGPHGLMVDQPVGDGQNQPKSTHSSGSGTAKSTIDAELDAAMGSTKRLLFPSPRKDDTPKALGELNVNMVQTSTECCQRKEVVTEKENLAVPQDGAENCGDDLEDLFRSPVPPRPSTPPSNAKAGPPATPFKTPTRATPNHRPVTRSVSRSIRSKESLASPVAEFKKTPSRTPRKTPRGDVEVPGSASRRRSPRHHHGVDFDDSIFDTPVSRAVNQMLSEPNFGLDDEMDLISMSVDVDDHDAPWREYSNLFNTDALMPSSPPKDGAGMGYAQTTESWAWSINQTTETKGEQNNA